MGPPILVAAPLAAFDHTTTTAGALDQRGA
jgi:hypothetical protein